MSLFQRHRGFLRSLTGGQCQTKKCHARSRQQKPIECVEQIGIECNEAKRAHSTENNSKIKTL